MPNDWSRQECVQGFDCEYFTPKAVNMFELMESVEYIYGGVVEHSDKKYTKVDSNHDGHSRQMR